jgi:hypothetical protein
MAIDKETIAVGYTNGSSARATFYSKGDNFGGNRGQWVILNASGALEKAVGTSFVLGILAASATSGTGDTSASTPVYVAWPDMIFEAQVFHSTTASAITARTQIGQSFAFKLSAAANIDAIDIETAAAATDQLTIIDHSRRDELGDTNGRLKFVVNTDNFQLMSRNAH